MDNDFATGYALGSDRDGCCNDGFMGGGQWIWAFLIIALIFGGNGGNIFFISPPVFASSIGLK